MEIVVFIVGLVFASIGGFIVWDGYRFRKTAREATGRVIGYEVRQSKSHKSSTRETYAPVVEYQHGGETRQFTGRLASSHISHQIGDKVPILLAARDAGDARLKGPGMIIIGGIFFTIGVAIMIFFFYIFQVSKFSLATAAFVILVLLVQGGMSLHRHNIRSIDDVKNAAARLKALKPASSQSNTQKQNRIITDPAQFARQRVKNRMPVWVAGVFFIAGLGLCAGGIYLAQKRQAFLDTAIVAEGVVVDFTHKTSTSDGKTTSTYYPKVRYTPTGYDTPVTFEHDWGSSNPSYSRGEQVRVLYSPISPDDAIIDEGWMNWLASILTLSIGLLFTLVGAATLRNRRKNKEEKQLQFHSR